MSQHSGDEPAVRVRRKSVLPARYDEYDLTGFTLPKPVPPPLSPLTHSPRLAECDDTQDGAFGFTPVLPGHEADSPSQWSDDEGASDIVARENAKLHNSLWTIQQERDIFQRANEQYAKELTQLQHQMRQLQFHMGQQRHESQPPAPVAPPRQYTSTHAVPAPRVWPQGGTNDMSFTPTPAPRLKYQSEYKARDQIRSLPHSSALRGNLSYHYVPEGDQSLNAHYSNPPYWHLQDPVRHPQIPFRTQTPSPPPEQGPYRGPTPMIPDFSHPSPREFSRLKIALENILPANATESFKFQILTDHLKLEEALLIADSYCHSQHPYTRTMAALDQQYGQPHQLALQRIAELMDGPNIASGDQKAFRLFALKVRSLVGMLEQLGRNGSFELQCGSHVSRLLGKLPHDLRSGFRRYAHPHQVPIPTLLDFAEWLDFEIQVQEDTTRFASSQRRMPQSRTRENLRDYKPAIKPTTIYLGTEKATVEPTPPIPLSRSSLKPYCPYCDNSKHSLNNCSNFKQLTKDQKQSWIKENNRCWRCGRTHKSADCNLKMRCRQCSSRHLMALHEISVGRPENPKLTQDESADPKTCLLNTMQEILLVHKPPTSRKVLLKICRVILSNGSKRMNAYAIQDDGSERTIILHSAAQQLGLTGQPEELPLRTIRQELQVLKGAAVSFTISPIAQPTKRFHITSAFTAQQLSLAEHSHPVKSLKERYRHLKGLPLQEFKAVCPVLLIGSDYPHLITPVEPVRLGPHGGPAAIKTRLGWTLQGPVQHMPKDVTEQHCLFTSVTSSESDLYKQVEKLWQMDVLPWRSDKACIRSRQDQEAVELLEKRTIRVEMDGVKRYATPLLRVKNMPELKAPKEAVLSQLRSTERRLAKNPQQAAAYITEIAKLEKSGYVKRVPPNAVTNTPCSWYIPHHMVEHNGKNRIVFNCSFQYHGQNLNELLLPGPVLGPSLLAVLLRFREHSVAVSSDIKGMFHQVRLLPEDKPLLRFLWRELNVQEQPTVYEWQVLPFGTTCSPCCAIFALQKHILDHSQPGDDVQNSVLKSFYVDNCLQSFTSAEAAKEFVDRIKNQLADGGFELRQWSSNIPSTINHLPPESISSSAELWISQGKSDIQESTLGLLWNHQSDTLSYKYRAKDSRETTMRNIYRILASQYDPLGYLIPYTTRAKILVQQLWDKKRDWDDPHLPTDLLQTWTEWEAELPALQNIVIPRCYCSANKDTETSLRDMHVFCDASERAYGSVAYLRTEDQYGQVEVAFLTARSRVAPKKQQSIPRLELCAALTGAQLSKVLLTELNLPIRHTILWTDSTTVLAWLQSESCRFKVFVGTRVAEIQELTEQHSWRYVPSTSNPADDITRGKSLCELNLESCWYQGPHFLKDPANQWPECPSPKEIDRDELRKTGTHVQVCFASSDYSQFKTLEELIDFTALQGAANGNPTASDYRRAEIDVLQKSQQESFPSDLTQLKAGKSLSSNSKLRALTPELDIETNLIRVGGRLRHSPYLGPDNMHPIILDPRHPTTKLIIQSYDSKLRHPGPERLFAEIRRKYWILRGREAIKHLQRECLHCQKWRKKPEVPRMADLPPARLRLFKPAFHSTGMDCFGPYTVKTGRRNEKKWGIIFKCLTTRAVYIDILHSLETDSFLMALRRFTARRGKPQELLSDQGTNFRGGERELKEAFTALAPDLQSQLAKQQIEFHFNPPNSPHFGGCWEREIRSLKNALMVTLGNQSVTFEVLQTVLAEIEGILNSKPLGYTSSDASDSNPITPNCLLMGRLDASLPLTVYPQSELVSRRRWRHSQILADQFWRHYIKFYLPGLQSRQKWQNDTPDTQVGSTVLIVDPQLPRSLWPVGKVVDVHPGADTRVRTAKVQVGKKTYTRPVARLIQLPAIPD